MVDESSGSHPKNNTISYISKLKVRISNDELYKSVKSWSFMTIPTSLAVAKVIRLKAQIMVKHIYSSTKRIKLKHSVITVRVKRKKNQFPTSSRS